jgi:hypothetical protein
MLDDRLWDWPLVWICVGLTALSVGLVFYSRSKWRADQIVHGHFTGVVPPGWPKS